MNEVGEFNLEKEENLIERDIPYDILVTSNKEFLKKLNVTLDRGPIYGNMEVVD